MSILDNHPNIVFSRSTVTDGNMGFPFGDEGDVETARAAFCNKIGIDPANVVAVWLVHDNQVIVPTESDRGKGMTVSSKGIYEADGGATNHSELGIFFVVADCVPVLLYDPKNQAFALLHCGRKGIEKGIIQVGFNKMAKSFNTQASDLLAVTGPGISAVSYVFDSNEDVDEAFWGEQFSLGSDGKYYMDIKAKIMQQILDLGVNKGNIEISKVDTFTDENYYSHRRSNATGEPEGRFAVVVYLKR